MGRGRARKSLMCPALVATVVMLLSFVYLSFVQLLGLG